MKLGLSLCPEVGRFSDMWEQARVAEQLGYDSVWLPEHHLMAGYIPAPLLGLASIASITERVQLGTDVLIAPFYSPVRLAEDIAVLDDMSGGRFVAGVALGYRREEFAALGVPYTQRGLRMTETLSALRRLLESESASFHGAHVSFEEVTIFPRPRQPIPIWVGGWSETAVRRAAEVGDAWFPGPTATVENVAAALAVYDRALAEQGKERGELPIFRELWVAETPRALKSGVELLKQMYVDDYLSWRHSNVGVGGDEDPWEGLQRDRFIVGSADDVAAGVLRLVDELGATHLIARMHFHGSHQRDVLTAMTLFAEKVAPHVRSGLGSASAVTP
jgi:probable F420-dependent oxidoreductase